MKDVGGGVLPLHLVRSSPSLSLLSFPPCPPQLAFSFFGGVGFASSFLFLFSFSHLCPLLSILIAATLTTHISTESARTRTAARGSPISPALVTTPASLYLKQPVPLDGLDLLDSPQLFPVRSSSIGLNLSNFPSPSPPSTPNSASFQSKPKTPLLSNTGTIQGPCLTLKRTMGPGLCVCYRPRLWLIH